MTHWKSTATAVLFYGTQGNDNLTCGRALTGGCAIVLQHEENTVVIINCGAVFRGAALFFRMGTGGAWAGRRDRFSFPGQQYKGGSL